MGFFDTPGTPGGASIIERNFLSPNSHCEYDKNCSLNYKKNTSSEHVLYKNCFCFLFFDIQNNTCTQHVLNLYFSCDSMNNLLSYCGLTDSRMRASEKDLPVLLVDMKTGSNGSAQEVFERRKAIENPRQKSSKYLLRVEEV